MFNRNKLKPELKYDLPTVGMYLLKMLGVMVVGLVLCTGAVWGAEVLMGMVGLKPDHNLLFSVTIPMGVVGEMTHLPLYDRTYTFNSDILYRSFQLLAVSVVFVLGMWVLFMNRWRGKLKPLPSALKITPEDFAKDEEEATTFTTPAHKARATPVFSSSKMTMSAIAIIMVGCIVGAGAANKLLLWLGITGLLHSLGLFVGAAGAALALFALARWVDKAPK